MLTLRTAFFLGLLACPTTATSTEGVPSKPRHAQQPAESTKPTAHTDRKLEGWTIRVDDRLLKGPDEALGARALRFLEAKLRFFSQVTAKATNRYNPSRIMLMLATGRRIFDERCSTRNAKNAAKWMGSDKIGRRMSPGAQSATGRLS